MSKNAVIKTVYSGSLAEEMGLCPGDAIVKINGSPVRDVLDYKFLSCDEEIEIEVLKKDGTCEIIDVLAYYEDLGVEFENSLMDKPKSCANRCIFCFIDQLPKGMRETVYFKDDDARLSFLQGNYITLTNLSERDIERIIKMRISPVNVSVHTTDEALRIFMLKNKNAGKLYGIMRRFYENKITMNCQIVLCPEINDGEHLKKTVYDLAALYPYVNSVSIVPVGLSAHREGLFPLKSFTKDGFLKVIKEVESWQDEFLKKYKSRIVYLSDEFYLGASLPLPNEEYYEGYVQIENGVGLITSMKAEFDRAIEEVDEYTKKRHISVVTGEIAYDFICSLIRRLEEKFPSFKAEVYKIKNNFFGGGVSVTGLLCAGDIIEQIKGKNLGEELFISESMLRAGDDIFLDDVTLPQLEKELNVKITPVENDGYCFIEKLLGEE